MSFLDFQKLYAVYEMEKDYDIVVQGYQTEQFKTKGG